MAEPKAAGAPPATQPNASGELSGAEPAPKGTLGKSAAPRGGKTLIGFPTQRPNALPPLRASTLASSPAAAPSKREPSLVILSRQIVNAVQRPLRGARLKPPTPPPRSDRDASHAAERKRRSADATDYNVEIISAYAAPPLPAKSRPHATAFDNSWEADVELLTDGKERTRTLVVVAVAVTCSVALAIYWL